MTTVFLSGGMSDLSMEEATLWRESFVKLIHEYYEEDIRCIDPTVFYVQQNDMPIPEEINKEAMRFDLYWVKHCDVLVVNMNNPKSIGTAQEMMMAYNTGKPIIAIVKEADVDKLHFWLKEEISKMIVWKRDMDLEDTIDETVSYIWEYYM